MTNVFIFAYFSSTDNAFQYYHLRNRKRKKVINNQVPKTFISGTQNEDFGYLFLESFLNKFNQNCSISPGKSQKVIFSAGSIIFKRR